jgi:hypothetical protein
VVGVIQGRSRDVFGGGQDKKNKEGYLMPK